MDVLVFRTDVTDINEVGKVNNLLTSVSTIHEWNFDLEDCDNILRIVAMGLSPREVELLLQGAGIGCEELAY